MKRLLLLTLLLAGGRFAHAQQNYFMYLQCDDRQPFYVLMNGKTYSSTQSGYLILSRLRDSTYMFAIGFPHNKFAEQLFSVPVNKKDAGYQIKNFGDKGWGLFNLQSMAVIMNKNDAPEKKSPDLSGIRKTDAFSLLMANVVNDSSILYSSITTIPPAAPTITATATAAPAAGEKIIAEKDTVATPVITANLEKRREDDSTALVTAPMHPVKDSSIVFVPKATEAMPELTEAITRLRSSITDSSYELVFEHRSTKSVDTIYISIPLEKENTAIQPATPVTLDSPVAARPANTPARKDIVEVEGNKLLIPNSDCRNVASENDVDKLRIKLLAIKENEDKIAAIKKVLRSKCFTVKQIKALSELFDTDEGKYQLFDVMYAFTYDSYDYALLGELISSDYFRKRFDAMLRK